MKERADVFLKHPPTTRATPLPPCENAPDVVLSILSSSAQPHRATDEDSLIFFFSFYIDFVAFKVFFEERKSQKRISCFLFFYFFSLAHTHTQTDRQTVYMCVVSKIVHLAGTRPAQVEKKQTFFRVCRRGGTDDCPSLFLSPSLQKN